MMRRLHLAKRCNGFRDFIHGVDAFFRIGGMAGLAEGFQDNLSSAPLTDFDIEARGFADDDDIRMNLLADGP